MRMSTAPDSKGLPSQAHSQAKPDHKPWYKHGWVWFLIGIPSSAVIAGAITLVIAINTADSLVADDYYKEGRGINQRLEKDQAALDRGIALKASITPGSGGMQIIAVRFSAKPGVAAPEMIRLRLSHPTINQKDILATLERSSTGLYETRLPGLAAGRWYAQMEDESASWRIKATWIVD